jgi:[protein-PII] uridylyltransferase
MALGDLRKLLSGSELPARLVQRRLRHSLYASAQPAVATKLRLDNRSSSRFTVLDVVAQDRPGLLFAIADSLHDAGASIELARIATEGNRATDAFYLSDARAAGGKLIADARGAEVMQAVLRAIDGLPI